MFFCVSEVESLEHEVPKEILCAGITLYMNS